jgi:hypothetical protein
MRYRIAVSFAFATLLAGCVSNGQQQATIQPEVPAGVGNAAQHPPLSGPPACSRAITEYEKVVDHDVTTGYLEQSVYNQIVAGLNSGPRPACASGRDADALKQLAAVKHAHGYR